MFNLINKIMKTVFLIFAGLCFILILITSLIGGKIVPNTLEHTNHLICLIGMIIAFILCLSFYSVLDRIDNLKK